MKVDGMSQIIYHKARWICPVTRPPIEGGMVAVKGNTIIGVGDKEDLKTGDGGRIIDHGDVAILPALVNTHTHLELSLLEKKTKTGVNFMCWLRSLLEERDKLDEEDFKAGILRGLQKSHENGTGLLADISTTGLSADYLQKVFIKSIVFIEALGFHSKKVPHYFEKLKTIFNRLKNNEHLHIGLAPHSSYTVSPELFKKVHTLSLGGFPVVSIHVAESQEETEFLRGKGPIYDLLRERQSWNGDWVPPEKSPVQYLDGLGLLTPYTLCIHVVQISNSDIEVLVKTKSKVCLCPCSNDKLAVGSPPVERLVRRGLQIALGTDSLASNDDLSVLREMAAIKGIAPSIPPAEIIKMGTINGAIALDMGEQLGSIEKGKEGLLIAIPVTSSAPGKLYEEIVTEGYRKRLQWINQDK
jgi:cytosine/adenosine deaminase-related metal-dependent hydrolase